ncbi:VanZ family protein [Herbiconiux sp. P17]|uniref:VanZ family protein n=1 Tax=Herbiconiux wuyangfengii TaxID=3342794 RepID=UPI0035B856C7
MRQITVVLLSLYGIAVLFVVAWPTPIDEASRGLLFRVLNALHRRGLPEIVDYNVIEFAANIAMFIPLGLLVALLLGPRWWWAAFFVCAGVSVSIELYQYLLLPDRYATVRDVVANSTGGAIGTLVAAFAIAWLRRPTPLSR